MHTSFYVGTHLILWTFLISPSSTFSSSFKAPTWTAVLRSNRPSSLATVYPSVTFLSAAIQLRAVPKIVAFFENEGFLYIVREN